VPIKQSNEAGPVGALKLELFLGDDDYQNQFILNSGAHIVVHNQSLTPIIVSEGIDIATGFQTNIGIKRSFLSKLVIISIVVIFRFFLFFNKVIFLIKVIIQN